MNCEYCNKDISKGYVETIETLNLKFFVCVDCMYILEDKLEKEFEKSLHNEEKKNNEN